MNERADTRAATLGRALRLECFTIGWNIIEGVIAVAAAVVASSVALLGFGIDSFVESLSAGVLFWRLNALFGWWWADPVAALGMTFLLVREGREAWEGKDDCCG